MTASKPPQPAGNDYKAWATKLNQYLIRTRSQLAQHIQNTTAVNDGVLVWDAANGQILYSHNGSWNALGSGGGGGNPTSLYYSGVAKATATADGLTVTGDVEATEFIGDLRGAVLFKAHAGEALAKGDVVYISGIDGNTTEVSKADADDAAKMPAFGLAAAAAASNAAVDVYTFGTLSGLDTSSHTEGDELFVGTTAGALVSTAPTGEGSLIQKIGKVTRSHATAGSIKIMGAGRTNATPNLNDGNIFIGDSNNIATTASFATEVAAATTGKADLSGATFTGTITAPNVDISTTGTVTTNIATGTGGLGDTKTLNLGTGYGGSLVGLTTVNIGTQSTACQNTVNIGSGVSVTNREDIINLKGNVTVDGTLNGATYEKVKRTRFLKRGYISTSIINTLTTSLSRIGDLLQTKSSDGSENELEFSMGLQYANTYGTNDGVFYVTVTAPTPSDEDTVNLGTVTSATTSGSLYTIALSGDVTKHLSPYCGMSVNSDGSSAFGFNNNQSWYYYSSNNTTYITMYAYQANKPLQGDTVYLHPFDWELAGTEILGTEYQFDKVVYNASLMFREYQNVYLGYFKSNLSVQVKAKEVTQPQGEDGTTILVRSIEGKITQTES